MDSTPQSPLGTLIRTRRRALGLNQEALAQRMVAHGDTTFRQTDVSRLELGKVSLPRRERIVRLAAVLDLSVDELVETWAACGRAASWTQHPPAQSTTNAPSERAQSTESNANGGSLELDDACSAAASRPRSPGAPEWLNLLAESEEIRFTSRHLRAQSHLRLERARRLYAEVVSILDAQIPDSAKR